MTPEQKQFFDEGAPVPLFRSLIRERQISVAQRVAVLLWCFQTLPVDDRGTVPRDLVADVPRALEALNMMHAVAIELYAEHELPDLVTGLGGNAFDTRRHVRERYAFAATFALAERDIIKGCKDTVALHWVLESCQDRAKASRVFCDHIAKTFFPGEAPAKRPVTLADLF